MVTLGGRFVAEMIAADHDARARERAAAGRGLFARLAGAFTEGRGGT